MTSSPFQDAVTIDTNVFEHLLNPQENADFHINELLAHLQKAEVHLVVDKGRRIANEYNHRIGPRIASGDDTRNEIYILRYWMEFVQRDEVQVSGSDNLMIAIRHVIIEPRENVDRIFAYVTLRQGKVLISNDRMNIVTGPPSESSERRHRLLQDTSRFRTGDADILTSLEAHARIQA